MRTPRHREVREIFQSQTSCASEGTSGCCNSQTLGVLKLNTIKINIKKHPTSQQNPLALLLIALFPHGFLLDKISIYSLPLPSRLGVRYVPPCPAWFVLSLIDSKYELDIVVRASEVEAGESGVRLRHKIILRPMASLRA